MDVGRSSSTLPLPIIFFDIFGTLNDYRMKCRIIGQNCGVILISDSIVATTGNRRKMPKQPDGHAVKRQLSIITIRKNMKNLCPIK
jgi:hypothetical protein